MIGKIISFIFGVIVGILFSDKIVTFTTELIKKIILHQFGG